MPTNQDQSTAIGAANTEAASAAAATPVKQKTEAGKILQGIAKVIESPFGWGTREFGNVAKLFQAEPAQLQTDLTAVSGVLQIIKLNISEDPTVISYLVRKAYPQFSEAALTTYLTQGITDLNIADKVLVNLEAGTEVTFPLIIQGIAQYVLKTNDTGWKLFWDGIFKAVATVAVPGTLWEKIISYSAYVYNVLVKPNVK